MVPLLLLLPLLWGESLQENLGYRLQVQESVTVRAVLGVHVPCSFSYPWSSWYSSVEPFIYWFREGDDPRSDPVATNNPKRRVKTETRGRFRLVGDPGNNDCSLSIRDARMSDAGVYYFRVERDDVKYSYRDKKLNLQVTELTLTPRPQDHGSNLTCRVTLQGSQGTLETTVWLNVSYAPQLVITRISQESFTDLNGTSLPVLEGQFLRLVCVADSNPPARLSWLWEGKPLSPSQRSAPGVLEIPRVGVGDGGEVTCQAQNPLGPQQVSFSLSVQKGPPSCSCETEEPQGSWPLVITLIRGALMGAGFLLTYGLTWIYYTRCGGH
ncbi:sialic acid-binding Ig-like lectin 14 isoform X2 [Dama dama]|uniref:sialic acid-binding Ig-like lectin 14 isoform X2 n=1 Tax=Dama dama TaxID=30532 RepID=UPI002A363258|nr:sialic acid-binding Ig-like lectin 14 isoform X2 [Dama dama]